MYKWSVPALLLSWVGTTFGAEALIIGQGHVLSDPDYIELNITVDSKCYASPEDARKVNDEAARNIVNFLNSKIKVKTTYNTVISTGGYTMPYETYYQNKYYCQNTFQKQNNITFRTQDVANFEALFNEIQNTVYKELSKGPSSFIGAPISYAIISSPMPSVSQERRSILEQQALARAFEDAKSKLLSLLGNKKAQNLRLINVTEQTAVYRPVYRQRSAPMAYAAGAMNEASPAPVQFGEEEINATVNFKFSFDDISLP